MSFYDLPKFNLPKFKLLKIKIPKISIPKFLKKKVFWIAVLIIFTSSFFGFLSGIISGGYFYLEIKESLSKFNIDLPGKSQDGSYVPQTTQEEMIINAVKESSPAVVSIVITKDVPVFEEYYINPFEGSGYPFEYSIPQYRQKGTEKKEIGGGTGFIISAQGMILTNKHVVLDQEADYTVYTNDGKSYPAKVLARDSLQDIAIIKIEQDKSVSSDGQISLKFFPTVRLGDSDKIQIGQTAIAIGNSLGEFRNTVSLGAVSGLGRTITASGGGMTETIEDVIQTDAAINKGNSGGPLLNLKGEVIGINSAMVQDAQNIGFSIPINRAKKDIEQVEKFNKIVYPFLGVRYVLINDKIQKEQNFSVNYGAWVTENSSGNEAIFPGSPAEKAGIKENDIILEFNGEKITTENTMSKVIMKYNPGDNVTLKVLRDKEEKVFEVVLEERK